MHKKNAVYDVKGEMQFTFLFRFFNITSIPEGNLAYNSQCRK